MSDVADIDIYRFLANDLIGAAAEEYCPRVDQPCDECAERMRKPVVAVLRTLANEADDRDAMSVSVTTLRAMADRVEHPAEGGEQ